MKKIVVIFAILCVVCSSAFAFAGVSNLFARSSDESVAEEVATETSSAKASETSSILKPLSQTVSDMALSKSKKAELTEAVEAVEEDVQALAKEAYGTKFLVNGGLTLGYDGDFIIGAIGQFGIRLGHGLIIQIGAEYDFFKTTSFEGEAPEGVIKVGDNWGIRTTINGYYNLKANITFGWEF